MSYDLFKSKDMRTHVLLVKNYRSHPSLLAISNIFYRSPN